MREKNILCPIDFSDCSKEALAKAVEIAKESAAKLTLFHAYQFPITEGALHAIGMIGEVAGETKESIDDWTAAAATSLGAERVDSISVNGVPHEEIVRRARELDCDLIVMGTHGRSGLKHAIVGSVAEKVVRHAPCTVMVVKGTTAPNA